MYTVLGLSGCSLIYGSSCTPCIIHMPCVWMVGEGGGAREGEWCLMYVLYISQDSFCDQYFLNIVKWSLQPRCSRRVFLRCAVQINLRDAKACFPGLVALH